MGCCQPIHDDNSEVFVTRQDFSIRITKENDNEMIGEFIDVNLGTEEDNSELYIDDPTGSTL